MAASTTNTIPNTTAITPPAPTPPWLGGADHTLATTCSALAFEDIALGNDDPSGSGASAGGERFGWKNSKAEGGNDMGFSKTRPCGARGCGTTGCSWACAKEYKSREEKTTKVAIDLFLCPEVKFEGESLGRSERVYM
ncbi:hypothetical protein COCNU_10G000260 [Cocos nucifera]|uniref:Uncharacterized protein n=1 Tax=Cocos nucifera TaxID=13894 RepID=A0A8K0ILJ6_COCNU|nr:hypothetical protein COCNU_10G000260 [Cocos nucifera]